MPKLPTQKVSSQIMPLALRAELTKLSAALTPQMAVQLHEHPQEDFQQLLTAALQRASTPAGPDDTLRDIRIRSLRTVLTNSEWLTAAQIQARGASLAGETLRPELWRQDLRIFALSYEDEPHYSRYALDQAYRPLPIVHAVLKALGSIDPWRVAVWFESTNAWLEDARPRTRLVIDPGSVRRALLYYHCGGHG